MKKRFYKKCLKSTILSAIIILIVSGILLVKDQNFTLRASSNVKEEQEYVYPIGLPVGLYLETDGVLVVDVGVIEDENSKTSNPLKGVVEPGDYITKFNNEKIKSKDQLMKIINENKGKDAVIEVNREGKIFTKQVNPIKTKTGEYMIGVWVRDDTQGIGTLTCITSDNRFTGLGHGISDMDTSTILDIEIGKIYKANIWGIKKGEQGTPGGLCGSIDYKDENILGDITSNSLSGIRGSITCDLVKEYELEKVLVASPSEVTEGNAKVQLILDNKVKLYDVKISNINPYNKEKSMVVKITDNELLKKTNGIVQGMSGAPILKDGKLVGAVTHVLVNDPTRGYGIFAENMLETARSLEGSQEQKNAG